MPGIDIPDNEFDQVSRKDQFLQNLDQVIQTNLSNEHFGVEQLAQTMTLSRAQLYRRLNDLTGKNSSQYIREYRLKKAMVMLKRDVASVSEIAYQVGFSSSSYFNKCFHDFYGITPGAVTHIDSEEDSDKIKPIYSETLSEDEQSVYLNRKANLGQVNQSDISISIETSKNSTQLISKRTFIGIFFSGIIIITVVLLWKFIPELIAPLEIKRSDRTIAVLPFKNDSPDQENDYFCNQLSEEIRSYLHKIEGLKVKPRLSVEKYRGQNADIQIIGKELNVSYLLEGSVSKIDNDLRITIRLIDAINEESLWDNNYDGKYTKEIFDFQRNIAKQVSASLHVVLSPEETENIERIPTDDIVAYDLYIRGKDELDMYWENRDNKHRKLASKFIDQALLYDPNYLNALLTKGRLAISFNQYDSLPYYADRIFDIETGSALGYWLLGKYYSFKNDPDATIENYNLALKNLKAGESLDMHNIDYQIGLIYCFGKHDVIKGLTYLQKSMVGEPEIIGHHYGKLADIFMKIGDYQRAESYNKKMIELMPIYDYWYILNQSRILLNQGKFHESIVFLDSIYNLTLRDKLCYKWLMHAHTMAGHWEEANIYYKRFLEPKDSFGIFLPQDSILLAYAYLNLGRRQEANHILNSNRDTFEKRLMADTNVFTLKTLASIHAILNEKEKSLEYLSKTLYREQEFASIASCAIDPRFKCLWDNPEFTEIIKRSREKAKSLRKKVNKMREQGEIIL